MKDELYLLDQTQLPLRVVEEKQETIQMVWNSIKQLKVRGAPAIGVAAAYGLLIGIREALEMSLEKFILHIEEKAAYLNNSRPTAVNLSWAMKRMIKKAQEAPVRNSHELYDILKKEAVAIHEEDALLCWKIGEHGASLIREGLGILTHCNAGALATTGIGTALAPIYLAKENGISFRIFADETRPLLQGARLTSWELRQADIDVTLITDSMAGHLMSHRLIDLVIVGTDRVAANGDVANKIGTLSVAILAKYFNIPHYVACPSSTIDLGAESGEKIEIEERESHEVTSFGERKTAPDGIKIRNPAFDVTPNRLVAGLITEKGIIRPPYKENIRDIFGQTSNILASNTSFP